MKIKLVRLPVSWKDVLKQKFLSKWTAVSQTTGGKWIRSKFRVSDDKALVSDTARLVCNSLDYTD